MMIIEKVLLVIVLFPILVDPISGELAGDKTSHKRMFYYIKGTEPTFTDSNLDVLIPSMKYVE